MIQAQAVKDKLILSPQTVTAAATAAGYLDTLGADYATIRVALGNIAQATIASADGVTVTLKESEDTNATNATTFVAAQSGIKFGRTVRFEVDTRSRKRYLHLSVAPGTSGVSNEPVTAAAFGTLSRLAQAPTSTSGMISGSNDAVIIT